MRIYEGDYAWEIERILDPATQLPLGWRYNLYRVCPEECLLRSGQEKTQDAAVRAGRRALGRVIRSEQRDEEHRKKRAA